VSSEIDFMGLIGAKTPIQWERSIWLRKEGDAILRGGDEGGSGNHVRQERICSDYVKGMVSVLQPRGLKLYAELQPWKSMDKKFLWDFR
jgi:hypothetical protein